MDDDEHQHDAVIAEFCALTSASPLVAENYLSAHDWDLNRSLDFFYEHPPEGEAGGHAVLPDSPPPLASAGVQAQPEGAGQPYASFGGAAAADHSHPGYIGEDDELERALAASMREEQGRARERSMQEQGPIIVDDDDDDPAALEALAQQRSRGVEARRAAERQMEGRMSGAMGMMEEMMRQAAAHNESLSVSGRGLHGSAGAGSSHPASMFPRGAEPRLPSLFPTEEVPALNGDEGAPGPSGHGLNGAHSIELPEGINVEEARMLEAAMLGIPYQGRIPDFAAEAAERAEREAAGLAGVDPSVVQQRQLVSEQDAAYEESLALDRAKQESIAAAERAAAEAAQRAKEEQRLAREAEVAARRRQEEEAAALQRLLGRKRSALPQEPHASEAGSLQVMVRMPDGSRKARRFRASDPLQAAFDFVDASGDGSPLPGSYRLVTQFPRRAFEDGSAGSFADAGITTDSAFFMELRS